MNNPAIHRDHPAETPDEALYRVKHWFLSLGDHLFSPHLALHHALVSAGFSGIRIERLTTHPVWEVRATLPAGTPFADRRQLKRQIRELLKSACLPTGRDEIVIVPSGRRLHFTFVQEAGRGVVMSHGTATLVEDEEPDAVEV